MPMIAQVPQSGMLKLILKLEGMSPTNYHKVGMVSIASDSILRSDFKKFWCSWLFHFKSPEYTLNLAHRWTE